ncbi:MAG: RHS repeat protein [Verrucomicrobia bacterium]|nr:MAG: RHS repeat protein [Verrucomicrobiota bacterium]
MKLPAFTRTVIPLLCSLLLFAPGRARATATADSQLSFTNLSITPGLGSLVFLTNWTASAFAQASANSVYNSGPGSQSAQATGDFSTARGDGFIITPFGLDVGASAAANASIPGQTEASDNATARGGMSSQFMITGGAGPVNVSFAALVSGSINLFTDNYGQYAEGETIFSFEVNGSPVLFDNSFFSIGPNDSASSSFTTPLNQNLLLQFNTPYFLYLEADAETYVVNAPEPGAVALLLMGSAVLWFVKRRSLRRAGAGRIAALTAAAALGLAGSAQAIYVGSEAPQICNLCGMPETRVVGGDLSTSLSEGNLREDYPVAALRNASGTILPFNLVYNSYNADNSRARVDVGLGFGWTHSQNSFLFNQRGHYFRMDSEGRVTQYRLGPGGTYTADTGYFETLNPQPDGSLIITNKEQSWWRFASVPSTTYLVSGPILRLTHAADRNGNVTTLSYSNGVLVLVTDPYGRSLSLGYTNGNHLARVTDPLGRVTRFQYDAQFRVLTRITDPDGKLTRYTYNSAYQLTRKIDRDARMNFYLYRNQKPYSIVDGLGQTIFSLSNPANWDTDRNTLAQWLRRVYTPTTTSKTNGLGQVWRYTYDTNGYVTRIVAPDGATTSYSYDGLSRRVAAATNENGAVTTYQYDSRGNRIAVTDALGNTTTYAYDGVFNQLTNRTDPNGRITTYQYDASGNRIREINPLDQTNSWTYDSNGHATSHTDRRGHVTTYSYDASGNLTNTTDASGSVTTYSYDAVGNRVSTTDALGRTTTYQYDSRDRVIGETNALGGTTTYQYDSLNRPTRRTDANSNSTDYQYDARGRLAGRTNTLGGVTTYDYDLDNNRTSATDELGRVTRYEYDSRDRLIRQTNALGGVSSMTYDPASNLTSQTDPNNYTTTYTYDALDRRITQTDPLGNLTRYDYAAPGGPPCCTPTVGSSHVTRLVDANGKVTFEKYDELDRVTQIIRKVGATNDVTDLDDAVTYYSYDAADNAIAVTESDGNTTTYAYDALNRITNMVNAAGDSLNHTYDAVGNLITTIAPNGNVITSLYDPLNRLTNRTDSAGLVTVTTYDAVGNTTSVSDALGHTTTYLYDGLDRRTTITDALGTPSTTGYDAVGNVIQTTDRAGHVTTYTYDSLDRRTGLTNALGFSTTYSYDAAGNRTAITDANGNPTTYQYDSLNRVIREIHPDAATNTVTNVYDGIGQRIGRVDQQGRVTTYNYNDLYQLTNRSYAPSGASDNFTYEKTGELVSAERGGWLTTFAYDGGHRLVASTQNGQTVTYTYNIPGRTRTITYPGGLALTITNDYRSRLLSVHDGTINPPLTIYAYDAADRVVTRTHRNGTFATYSYNSNNWITSLEHSNGVARIAGFSYAYDVEGKKLSEEKRHQPGDSETYTYDDLHRLTNFAAGTLVGLVIPSPTLLRTWTLDPLGNWSLNVSNSIPETRSHNAANELTLQNGNPIFHDDSGNLQQDTGYAYLYDEENRLTQITRLSDSAIVGRYYYDALGRRVVRVANASGTPATNVFFYDSTRIIEERNPAGTVLANYTYGNYEDEVLTMNRAGQTHYYHQNSQYSPHALTDSSGNAAERYTYDAYGCPTVLDATYTPLAPNAWGTPHSPLTNTWVFTGRELDEESGGFYFRARAYDCNKGRFLQRDPLGLVMGENLYLAGFVPNHLDPSGMQTVEGCSSGGSTTCPINPNPVCRCRNPARATPWDLTGGGLGEPNIIVAASRTYNILRDDGTRANVTCRRTQAWQDASRAHENQHVANCRARVRALNATAEGGNPYATRETCVAALNTWADGWRTWWAGEAAHTNPESPAPTNCADEFADENGAGRCP